MFVGDDDKKDGNGDHEKEEGDGDGDGNVSAILRLSKALCLQVFGSISDI